MSVQLTVAADMTQGSSEFEQGPPLPQLPRVSVIVTHMNYSTLVGDALRSLLAQTYENWECVVVDDGSSSDHRLALETIVSALATSKIQVLWLDQNVGQIPAFFAGLDATTGPFVTSLDADDRLAPEFLEDCVRAHLNPVVYCPIVSTEEILVGPTGQLTGTYKGSARRPLEKKGGMIVVPEQIEPVLSYVPPAVNGWHWSTTSAMMFRRSALAHLRPQWPLGYKHALDTYLAPAVHALGGTLFWTRPLVYRLVHGENAYLSDSILSTSQKKMKANAADTSMARKDALEAIAANGASHLLLSIPSGDEEPAGVDGEEPPSETAQS